LKHLSSNPNQDWRLTTEGVEVTFFGGRARDLISVRHVHQKGKSVLLSGNNDTKASETDCKSLLKEVAKLSQSDSYASVSLPSGVVQKLKESIRKISATHVRLFNDGDKLRIMVFDYVKFHSSFRLPRKSSNLIRYYDTRTIVHRNFSTTFLAASFARLSTENLHIRIGENGISQISTEKGGTVLLLRDQELKEPMVVFESPQVGRHICFVFHPN
jgi:hypothetical protein